jgi:GT2 family glycosyltransferase
MIFSGPAFTKGLGDMTRSTILLPNFNNEHALPVMFEALRRTIDCSEFEFVVVDDGSEDRSLAILKDQVSASGFARSEVISRKHKGIVHTLNAGLEAVRTPYVIRIDGDATVETPGWANRLQEWLDEDASVGLVGGHIIFDSGKIHSYGRSVVSELGLFDIGTIPAEPIGYRTFDGHVVRPMVDFPGGKPYQVDTLLGVCAAFRLSDARDIGGFDVRFNPVWIEDDDFGLSLRKLGRHVIIDPSIQAVHRISLRNYRRPGGSTALPKMNPRRSEFSRRLKAASRALRGKVKSWYEREGNQWRMDILKHHYAAWKEKWGFDPLNPDLKAIIDRYWDTQVCWKYNPKMQAQNRYAWARL